MSSRRKLLLPLLTLKENGGVAVAMAFARQATAGGEHVVIIASGFHGTKAVEDPINAGIEFVISPVLPGGRLGALVGFFGHAFAWSLRHRPRLVYTHVATSLVPNFSGLRAFMIAQDIEYRFFRGPLRSIAKHVFARAIRQSHLIVSSMWLERYFRRFGCDIAFAGDVGIARRVFDERVADDGRPREFDFLMIAKRGAHKRHAETLQVAEALAGEGSRVRLIDQAQGEAAAGVSPRTVVSGAVSADTMRQLYGQARVFVSASKAEGYGLTPLEALASGCSVVSTPTPSTTTLQMPQLTLVAGSDDLVPRLAQAARQALQGAGGPSVDAQQIPCMEDWSAGAYDAFERVSRG